jgi:hypothetical protein
VTSRRARRAGLRAAVLRAVIRGLARAAAVVVIAAVLAAAAPVTIAGLAGTWLAWLRGWPPARLYRAAAWCCPMLAVWLAAVAVHGRGLAPVAVAPYDAWLDMWRDGATGSYLRAAVVITPAAVPLGLIAAGLAWSVRLQSMASLAGRTSPAGTIAFDRRQWRHQVRAARARSAAPGSVPLLTAGGDFAAGTVIRSVGHRPRMLTRLPPDRLRSHQIVVGGTGTGKTTLLLRLWAAYMAAGLSRHAAGRAGPPLVVVLDCKGGADARRIADRARRVLRAAGARNVAVWPDEAALNLWALPPRQLITTLVDLIEHGSGGAAYYTDVMDAVVALAVEAPCGPPVSSPDFLARLEPGWLTLAYSAGGLDDQLQAVRAATGQLADIALRYRTLFRRLGGGLDGPGDFADADAWYCIVEGTAELRVAEAQARALVDLLASYVSRSSAGPGAPAPLQVLLAVDEFGAVSRRLPIWQLYERARALGLAVQISAQSWHGLAPAEADRYRIAATAEGGIWLLRTAHPEPLAELAGQRKAVGTTRQLLGLLRWGGQGSSRVQATPVVDAGLIRGLDVGQAAYIYRGGVTYTQVKRLVAGPAALTAVSRDRHAPGALVTGRQAARAEGPQRPDIAPFLDAAFGRPAASGRGVASAPASGPEPPDGPR